LHWNKYKNELGIESSNVDCNEHCFTDQNKETKFPGEIALANAIHTGARLTKKINELELKFSNDHDENKKLVKKVGSRKKSLIIAKPKKAKVRRVPSDLLNIFNLLFIKFQHCLSILRLG
jgi:hypothetical protein